MFLFLWNDLKFIDIPNFVMKDSFFYMHLSLNLMLKQIDSVNILIKRL